MAEFKELEFVTVNVIEDGNIDDPKQMKLVPIFSLDAQWVESFKEKRQDRLWGDFKKNLTVENPKTDYRVVTDVSIVDAGDPFQDEKYRDVVITDLPSMMKIKPSRRKNLDVGLRLVDGDNNAHLLPDVVNDIIGVDTLAHGINFDLIDDIYTRATSALEQHFKETVEIENEKREAEAQKALDAEVDEQYEDTTDEVESTDDEPVAQEPVAQEPVYQEPEIEKTPFDYLQDDLYATIDKIVPPIPELTESEPVASLKNVRQNDEYQELKNVAHERIMARREKALKLAEAHRNELVNTLYYKLSKELLSKHLENDKIYAYDTQESELHGQYKNIMDNVQDALSKLGAKREERLAIENESYQKDLQDAINQAIEETKIRFEREVRPRIQDNANAFVNDLERQILDTRDNELGALYRTADTVRGERYYQLVDGVVNAHSEDIEKSIESLTDIFETKFNELEDIDSNELVDLQKEIQNIEIERVKGKKDFNERVDIEVEKRTADVTKLQMTNEQMAKELEQLKAQLNRHSEEGRSLQDRLEFAEKDAQKYKELYETQVEKTFEVQDKSVDRMSAVTPAYQPPVETSKLGKKIPMNAPILGAVIMGTALIGGGAGHEVANNQIHDVETKYEQQNQRLEDKVKSLEERPTPVVTSNKKVGDTIKVQTPDDKAPKDRKIIKVEGDKYIVAGENGKKIEVKR